MTSLSTAKNSDPIGLTSADAALGLKTHLYVKTKGLQVGTDDNIKISESPLITNNVFQFLKAFFIRYNI